MVHNRGVLMWSIRIAAVFILGIFIGWFGPRLIESDPSMCSIVAPKGSISQMVLPDSTIVYLNSDSKIQYAPGSFNRTREVQLDGEAWFQVTENERKPFLLRTDYYDVMVTGTEFNVKAYANEQDIVTTLEKGSIVIPSTGSFKMKSDRKLVPGQQFVYDRENRVVNVTNVETRYFSAWKDNKLIFINMSLEQLQILLERKYGVDIEIMDKSLLNYHYDGTFKNESILEIMELLKVTLPIDYQIVDQKIEIFTEIEKP
jgi:ferric-dicitrate binding protein FerR (iron transport regulator)